MKKTVLEPLISDESVIVQFSGDALIDKTLSVTVPDGYAAFVFADEKVQFRIQPCAEKKLSAYGKELNGKKCFVAFVRTKPVPPLAWGFGNIQVNNERLKEAYRVGANGSYAVELVQPPKLIAQFGREDNITAEKLRERTISVVKNIGTALLGTYFAGTDISVFEIASCTAELRAKFLAALQGEPIFADLGFAVKNLTVDGIHVNEEDLALIRSRINAPEQSRKQTAEAQEKFAEDILRRLDEKFERLRAQMERGNDSPDWEREMQRMREKLTADLSELLGGRLQEMQDILADSLDERLQELMPLKELAKNGPGGENITAKNIIAGARDGEEFVPAVAMLYTNIEENLIKKFRLRHEREKFVMDYEEYEELSKTARLADGRYLLRRYDKRTGRYQIIMPRVVEEGENGKPEVVEMLPVVRFLKAGLNTEQALRANGYWTAFNKIRHRSEENSRYLQGRFAGVEEERAYLQAALQFFTEHGLYTKE